MNVRRFLLATAFAMCLGGCATEGGASAGVAEDWWYYEPWYGAYGWYGAVACCADWPEEVGPPRPEHPIALPPGGNAPRPSNPIANVPGDGARPSNPIASQPKASTMSSPRPAAMPRGGGMRGGGGRR